MVTARNVSKKFGSIIALSDIDLHVKTGEFVFLTGPSGSGKTTLMRLILRDLKPDSGTLLVNNQDLAKLSTSKLPQYRRSIGPIFQDYKLLADRIISENISLPLQIRRLKPVDIAAAVKIALEMVDLSDKANLFPGQLSGGELQRVAIARAVVSRPNLVLADEPTGNLDPKTAKSILKLLTDIHSELKTTVIMATHNAELVNHVAFRVVSLEKGKIIRDEAKGKYDKSS